MCGKGKYDRSDAGNATGDRDCGEAAAVCHVLAEVIAKWRYPASVLSGSGPDARLPAGFGFGGMNPEHLDLIFEACGGYFEITLQGAGDATAYCGRIMRGREIAITGETVNGHRVLIVTLPDGGRVRHEFRAGAGYMPVAGSASATIH